MSYNELINRISSDNVLLAELLDMADMQSRAVRILELSADWELSATLEEVRDYLLHLEEVVRDGQAVT